jgi:xanthine dehydrogenase YagS FAD-binding subunit
MKLFTYSQVSDSPATAVKKAADQTDSHYIGGGTNLIDLMKELVVQPSHLVDVSRLDGERVDKLPNGAVLISGTSRNSDVANHELIRQGYPLLSRALLAGASPQIRNMATVAGNLMQRTRCYYFYDIDSACNKRTPGTGCDAIKGYNRMNAILGGSKNCIAVHPSDMCVALACLDAVVHTHGLNGDRKISFSDFYKLPGNSPHIETVLAEHELITAVELPPSKLNNHWCYLKVRDRAAYAFALVSVAAALDIQGGKIKTARLALGGVAPKPWRNLEAERMLVGTAPNERSFKAAAEAIMKDAKTYEYNKFKVELGKRTIVRALKVAAGGVS